MTDDDAEKVLLGSRATRALDVATNSSSAKVDGTGEGLPVCGRWKWFWGLLLVVATFIAYQPVWHAGFIWDDDRYVTSNPLLTAPDGLKHIWFSAHKQSQYFPLVFTNFRLQHWLWDLNPLGYHLINVLLHSANALLVWTVLRRLSVLGAWLGAALFALHPVHVESVAWITELKNTQSTFFYLLALLSWMKFAGREAARPGWPYYALAFLFYAAALLSKTTACTLPAAMLLVLWLQHRPIGMRRIIQITPFLVLGVGSGLAAVWWEKHLGNYWVEVGQSFNGVERLLIASRALWFYAAKLVWPVNLTFSYPCWEINARNPLQYIWLAAGMALVLFLWLRRGVLGRGPIVAAIFFIAALSPLLGFIPLYTFRYSFVADHYQYVASIGPLALAAAAIARVLQSIHTGKPFLKFTGCGILLLVLGVLTWRQSATYANAETLWRTTIERNPDSDLAHNNLGNILFKQGHVDEAIGHYVRALAVQPEYPEGHYNLGMALLKQGQADEAIPHLEKASQPGLDSRKVRALAGSNLGDLLLQQGRKDEAIAHYRTAIQMDPGLASARSSLGNVLFQQGQVAEAIANYEVAIRLQPDNPLTLNNLAWVLATCSDASLRNGVKAVGLAERACELTDHSQPIFIGTLAAAYAEAGQFERAVTAAQQAGNLALSLGQTNLVEKNEELLLQFKQGKPWRE